MGAPNEGLLVPVGRAMVGAQFGPKTGASVRKNPPHITLLALLGLGCQSPDSPKPGAVDLDPTEDTSDPGDDTGDDTEETDPVYDLEHVLQVEIELDPDDWETLRHETRNILELLAGDCLTEPFGSPYTWFPGTVTIDGQTFSPIDVRKKGFIGSLSDDKPSLKLDLVEYDDDLNFEGAERLTLNNAVSDGSLIRQCIGYGIFADAGIAAPRCSFTHVHVNGVDMGVYVNIEPVKEPFLARHFGDGSGNLYEGTLSDFDTEYIGTLEKKTNEDDPDRSDVNALVAALQADDDALISELEAVMDLDWFFTYWATEVLVMHRDGYASNTNNFYVYADPTDGRLHFMPWGTDDILHDDGGDDFGSPNTSVYANGVLARTLYQHPEGQARYLARLRELLDTVWREDVFAARVATMVTVLTPELSADELRTMQREVRQVERALNERRQIIEEATADGPERLRPGSGATSCLDEKGAYEATFTAAWDVGSFSSIPGLGTLDLVMSLDEEDFAFTSTGAFAARDGGTRLVVLEAEPGDGRVFTLYMELHEGALAPGRYSLDLIHNAGYLLISDPSVGLEYDFVGYLGGSLVLDSAAETRGAPIEGTAGGGIYDW